MFNRINFKSQLLKNTLILMSGTIVAQAIPLLVSPILTRIYSPELFGIFAVFMSMTTILAVFSTGKYDLAIILPKNDDDGLSLVVLSFFICILFCIFLTIVILIFGKDLTFFISEVKIFDWIYLLPFSVFLVSSFDILSSLANRHKSYKKMALSKIFQSFTTSFINIFNALFFISYWGLIMGRVIGSIIAIISLIKLYPKININFNFKLKALLFQAKRYKKFPKFTLPTEILSVGTTELPIFLFFTLYSSTAVALYAFALRMVSAPLGIIGSSLTTVFRQTAAELYLQNGHCRQLFIKTFKTLLLISIVPFLILSIFSPDIFSFIFGDNWREAGVYVQIMSPMFFFQFIISPLSYMYYIAEQQKEDLFLHIYISLSSLFAIFLGYKIYNDVYFSILFYSLNWVLVYIYTGIRSYHFSKGILSNETNS